jgi:hypothetical protein
MNNDIGYGTIHVLGSSYSEIYTVCPKLNLVALEGGQPDCMVDHHESLMSDATVGDTMIVTAYNITQADLSAVGGPQDGWIWDSMFFKIKVETGDIMYSWSSLGSGIPFSESKQPIGSSGT